VLTIACASWRRAAHGLGLSGGAGEGHDSVLTHVESRA
jgi:hypothetical protein